MLTRFSTRGKPEELRDPAVLDSAAHFAINPTIMDGRGTLYSSPPAPRLAQNTPPAANVTMWVILGNVLKFCSVREV